MKKYNKKCLDALGQLLAQREECFCESFHITASNFGFFESPYISKQGKKEIEIHLNSILKECPCQIRKHQKEVIFGKEK